MQRNRSGKRGSVARLARACLALALLVVAAPAHAQNAPVVFDPASYTPPSACDGLAYAAQTIADGARAAHPDDDAAAVDAFDTSVAMFYIGRPMKTVGDAIALLRPRVSAANSGTAARIGARPGSTRPIGTPARRRRADHRPRSIRPTTRWPT